MSFIYYIELKLNASSIGSLIDASSIKFTVYKELYNVRHFYIFLIITFLSTYCKVTRFFVSCFIKNNWID